LEEGIVRSNMAHNGQDGLLPLRRPIIVTLATSIMRRRHKEMLTACLSPSQIIDGTSEIESILCPDQHITTLVESCSTISCGLLRRRINSSCGIEK
jgi:hypothetical protein